MARKEKKYHFIYKTTNLLSGKYYIGMHSTNDLDDGYMGSGKRLRYSVNKYGVANHKREILEFFEDRQQLAAREREIVNLNEIAKEECMNLKVGGDGGLIGLSIKLRKKISKAANEKKKELFKNEEWSKQYSKTLSEAWKISFESGVRKKNFGNKSNTNKKLSDKTKELMSEKAKQRIGNKNSQYGTCWIVKEGIAKKIKKEELNSHLKKGWFKGRKQQSVA